MPKLRWPQHPVGAHVRTCQECGHTHVSRTPDQPHDGWSGWDAWCNAKCRKCHSAALDFGSENMVEEEDDDEHAFVPSDEDPLYCQHCGASETDHRL